MTKSYPIRLIYDSRKRHLFAMASMAIGLAIMLLLGHDSAVYAGTDDVVENDNPLIEARESVIYSIGFSLDAPSVEESLLDHIEPAPVEGVSAAYSLQSNETIADDFENDDYDGSTGSQPWLGNWTEFDDDGQSDKGEIKADKGILEFKAKNTGPLIYRDANLSSAATATLNVDINKNDISKNSEIVLEVSNNGGSSFTTLETYDEGGQGTGTYDLMAALGSLSANTRIRFRIAVGDDDKDKLDVEAVTISYTTGTPPPNNAQSGSVDVRISSIDDDAEETSSGASTGDMHLDSSDMELIDDSDSGYGPQTVGLRFRNITIPQGATIDSAYLTFRSVSADGTNSNSSSTSLTIRAHDTDNASAFTSSDFNISNRTTTSASASWNPSSWSTGSDYNSADFKSVVQEVVNRNGWSSGNSMAIIVTGSGHRSAQSYDSSPSTAARLRINWSNPTLTNTISVPSGPINSGAPFVVTQVLQSDVSIDGVTPSNLTVTGTNGVGATLVSGPSPASATVGPSGTTFTWTYQATDAGSPGQLTFSGNASAGAYTWPNATSNGLAVEVQNAVAVESGPPPVVTFFVPFPEDEVLDTLESIYDLGAVPLPR